MMLSVVGTLLRASQNKNGGLRPHFCFPRAEKNLNSPLTTAVL